MKNVKLYHLSENGNIIQFVPTRSKEMWGFKKYVWAISEEKVHNYLLPRECPRICLSKKESRIVSDWVDKKEYKACIFIPIEWIEEIKNCTLYKYQFNPDNFHEIDSIAGYFVSDKIEYPIDVEKINNCLQLLILSDIEVKFLEIPQMKQLKELVTQSAKEFSIIKWVNIDNDI